MPPRALLIDALGTTVRLLPPWTRVDPAVVTGLAPVRVEEAFRVEMAYYGAHAHEAGDAESLAALRAECAALLGRELARPISVETLMGAIAFEAYPDARPALADARALGLRVICVSNWDGALGEVLERVGLAGCFDGVVASALAGVRKPDPAIFERALELAGCEAPEALHVGDTSDDVEGARAAGIAMLRIGRDGSGGDIVSLGQLGPHLRGTRPGSSISEHSS